MTKEEFNKQVEELMDSYLRANYPEIQNMEDKVSCISEEANYLDKLKKGSAVMAAEQIVAYDKSEPTFVLFKMIRDAEPSETDKPKSTFKEFIESAPIEGHMSVGEMFGETTVPEGKILFGNRFSVLSRGPRNTDYVLVEEVNLTYPYWRVCEGETMLFSLAGTGYIICKDRDGEMHVSNLYPNSDITFFMEKGDQFIITPCKKSAPVVCIVSDTSMEQSQAILFKENELEQIMVEYNAQI